MLLQELKMESKNTQYFLKGMCGLISLVMSKVYFFLAGFFLPDTSIWFAIW